MARIVDSSWPRMGSDLENPFQNVPGRFFHALPDLRSSLSFGTSPSGDSSAPSLQHSSLELKGKGKGKVAPLPRDESGFDRDGWWTQGESEPKQGEADSEPNANSRSESRTPIPAPLSPTSTTSSEQERTTEKTKRSRRRRRRNRPVVDVGGCVMGPRMVHFPAHIPYWTRNHTPGIVPSSPWSPASGYPVVTAPGGDPLV